MTPALLLLAMLDMGDCKSSPSCVRRARLAAPVIHREAGGLDPRLVARVAFKESSFRPGAVGARGEVGLMQVLPGGRAVELCGDLEVSRPRENVRCAVRILRWARDLCGGEPLNWLGAYQRGHCRGPSVYARRVLAL